MRSLRSTPLRVRRRSARRAASAAVALALAAPLLLAAPGPAAADTPAPAAPVAYVVDQCCGTLTAVDTATRQPTGRITLPDGSRPARIAAAPDGRHLYVTDQGAPVVRVVDPADPGRNTAVATRTGTQAIAVSPDGTRVYAGDHQGDPALGALSVLDPAAGTVTATVPLGFLPEDAAVSPDGRDLYLTQPQGLTVVDTRTNAVAATLPLPGSPRQVAFAPDGRHAYVTEYDSGVVAVVDTATRTVSAEVQVYAGADGVAVSPDGTRGYATSALGPTVTAFATGGGQVTGIVETPDEPGALALTPDGSQLWVANPADDYLTVVDTASNTVTDRVRGVRGPVDLVIPAPPAPVDPPAEPKADLAVTLDAAAVPALLGGRIDYTLTVTDTSTTTASTGATVTVALTPGTLTPATTAPGCTAAPGRLTCTLTGLAPGASARRTFSLPVALLSLGTAYKATATRTAATPADPGPGNDSASRSCTALTALIITCG